ncbi:hypothetical protein VIMS_05096 [Mycobacterium marinum]|nr:hypothetical protein VIMS_05096 [Mycobacterium marinum]
MMGWALLSESGPQMSRGQGLSTPVNMCDPLCKVME